MAGSVNKVIIVGNLGKDPEIRTTQSGSNIVNMTVATSETWNDKASGERKEKTEWHRVVIFNERLTSVAERFLKKGSKVYLEGSLQTRKYTDNSGNEKYTTEVVLSAFRGELTLLDSREGGSGGASARDDAGGWDSGNGRQASGNGGGRRPKSDYAPAGSFKKGPDADLEDSIPF